MIIVFFNKIFMLYELFVEIYYIRKDIMIGVILSLGYCILIGSN